MEFTINTTAKVISFKGRVNLADLINELADLGIDFTEYTIEGESYNYTPIIFPETKPYVPENPWVNPWTTPWVQPWTYPTNPIVYYTT